MIFILKILTLFSSVAFGMLFVSYLIVITEICEITINRYIILCFFIFVFLFSVRIYLRYFSIVNNKSLSIDSNILTIIASTSIIFFIFLTSYDLLFHIINIFLIILFLFVLHSMKRKEQKNGIRPEQKKD